MAKFVDVYKEEIDTKMEKGDSFVVVITAPWCASCRILKSQLEYEPGVVYTLNSDTALDWCASMGVRSLPTTILYEKGSAIGMFRGTSYAKEIAAAMLDYFEEGNV